LFLEGGVKGEEGGFEGEEGGFKEDSAVVFVRVASGVYKRGEASFVRAPASVSARPSTEA